MSNLERIHCNARTTINILSTREEECKKSRLMHCPLTSIHDGIVSDCRIEAGFDVTRKLYRRYRTLRGPTFDRYRHPIGIQKYLGTYRYASSRKLTMLARVKLHPHYKSQDGRISSPLTISWQQLSRITTSICCYVLASY